MKTNSTNPNGMKAQGVGPRIVLITLPALIAGIVVKIISPQSICLPVQTDPAVSLAGLIWLLLGVILWGIALGQFARAFPKGKLVTGGVYRFSRNPIYSSFIVFVLPGLALMNNNLLFLLSALIMYLALRFHIQHEERELEKVFGEQYISYKENTGRVFLIK